MRLIPESPTPTPPKVPENWKTITIRWPSKPGIPCVAGNWRRLSDGRVEARYAREELEFIYNLGLLDLSQTEKAG